MCIRDRFTTLELSQGAKHLRAAIGVVVAFGPPATGQNLMGAPAWKRSGRVQLRTSRAPISDPRLFVRAMAWQGRTPVRDKAVRSGLVEPGPAKSLGGDDRGVQIPGASVKTRRMKPPGQDPRRTHGNSLTRFS